MLLRIKQSVEAFAVAWLTLVRNPLQKAHVEPKLVPLDRGAGDLDERQGCENEQQNEGVRNAEW